MTLPGTPFFAMREGVMYAEEVPLPDIAARFGTPCYVYSRAALIERFSACQAALNAHPAGKNSLICYAVKVNSNLAILNLFARLGAGFDIVSGGELKRVLAAGGRADKVMFSGVGKSEAEMELALNAGIFSFNVESAAELERLNRVAGRIGRIAPISLRVNPDVDPKTHPYIATGLKTSKFGVAMNDAPDLYARAVKLPNLAVRGIDCHIGSQITDPLPFAEALERLLDLMEHLEKQGIAIHHLDLGGGFGIPYRMGEAAVSFADFLTPLLDRLQQSGQGCAIVLEPGRSLVGNAGLLLAKVEYLKMGAEKNFAVVDTAMNDLLRPALYGAWHEIVPVSPGGTEAFYDVVGPICESGDFLGQDRKLAISEGDYLAVLSAGAYSFAMSSNYNSRPRAAEIMVDGADAVLIRRRETVEESFALERIHGE
ncbi:MAG: diaminopimelate decarboxylase [Betaproteobacteria bacterium]|nr:diaminopimelate decarboxylase [Betaproteobacteria bacterium]